MKKPKKNCNIKEIPWGAFWIWSAEECNKRISLMRFRYKFSLPEDITDYSGFLRISADSKYKLFINEIFIGRGPCRSDLQHYSYETYEITDEIFSRENIITVEVLSFGNGGPVGEIHDRPGLIIDGGIFDENGDVIYAIKTDQEWQSKEDLSFDVHREDVNYAVTFGEIIDGGKREEGWHGIDFDDSDWICCQKTEIPFFAKMGLDPSSRKWLCPNDIPSQEEIQKKFQDIVKSTENIDLDFNLELAPFESLSFIIDAGCLTTGYPEITIEGGEGREIKLTYAEALWVGNDKIRNTNNLPESIDVIGYYDIYVSSGGISVYQPFILRTFRFIKVEIAAGKSPLRLLNMDYLFSAYPFTEKTGFECSDPDCGKLFDISFRTARLCAHEHYEDCPYYERLQYVGDTRLQALISYWITGDTRLGRRAVEMFDFSRVPEGLTQSRYPSNHLQVIPPFSLFWIMMVEDYLMYSGDIKFAAGMKTGILSVLNWFEYHIKDGLVADLPYWNFVDWSQGWKKGVPPLSKEGISTIINLQFVAALQSAVRIFKICGMMDIGGRLLRLSSTLQKKIRKRCFSKDQGIYLDAPGEPFKSQHANIWAILTDTASSEEQHEIATKVLLDKEMTQLTYYHSFYLFRTFSKLNRYAEVYPLLDNWRNLIKEGFTTWPETPGRTRSDCHAWSAWIIFDFVTEILGVKPQDPGLKKILIKPSICKLDFARGKVPYADTYIDVEWRMIDKHFIISGDIPVGYEAKIILPSQKIYENVKGNFEIKDDFMENYVSVEDKIEITKI